MPKKISSIDFIRITHINILMDGYYEKLASIYEHLTDHELKDAQREIAVLIRELRKLSQSMEDEI